MHCVKCKKRTETTNERTTKTKNNRHQKRGTCILAERLKRSLLKRQRVVLC